MKGRTFFPLLWGIAFFTLCGMNHQALAEVYKWRDAKGKLHFGDKPPVEAKSEKMDINTKGVYQSSGDYKRRQQKLLNVFDEERRIRQKEKEKENEQKEKVKQACDRARRYEDRYERSSLLYQEKADGTRTYMSDEEREKAETELQAFLKNNCSK